MIRTLAIAAALLTSTASFAADNKEDRYFNCLIGSGSISLYQQHRHDLKETITAQRATETAMHYAAKQCRSRSVPMPLGGDDDFYYTLLHFAETLFKKGTEE